MQVLTLLGPDRSGDKLQACFVFVPFVGAIIVLKGQIMLVQETLMDFN